jgi:hypothetical protein
MYWFIKAFVLTHPEKETALGFKSELLGRDI